MAQPGTVGNIASATLTTKSLGRRTITVVLILAGALVTINGLTPETPWKDFLTLITPNVALGLIIQVLGGILRSGGGNGED